MALQGQKGLKNLPKITFEDLSHMLGHNFVKKGRGIATVVCVQAWLMKQVPLALMAINSQLWQLLIQFLLKMPLTQRVI